MIDRLRKADQESGAQLLPYSFLYFPPLFIKWKEDHSLNASVFLRLLDN